MGYERGGDGCHLREGNQGGRATARGSPFFDLVHCHPNSWSLGSWQTSSWLSKNFLSLLHPQSARKRQPSRLLCHLRVWPACGSGFLLGCRQRGMAEARPPGMGCRAPAVQGQVEACSLEGDQSPGCLLQHLPHFPSFGCGLTEFPARSFLCRRLMSEGGCGALWPGEGATGAPAAVLCCGF